MGDLVERKGTDTNFKLMAIKMATETSNCAVAWKFCV
jgi:hypothetical protein